LNRGWFRPEVEGLVRVAVVEEHALFRRAMVVALERDEAVEVVVDAASIEDFVDGDLDVPFDVVLLDTGASLTSLGRMVRAVLDRRPTAQVVLAVTDEADPVTYDGLRAGAAGVLHKDIATATAAEAVRAVRSGNILLTTYLAGRVLAEYGDFARRARTGEVVPVLTDDERRVLSLIADGSPATAVAVAARLPASTARNLVRNAVLKLQRHVAGELAAAR